MVFYIMDNAESKVTLDHCNHAVFFFFFSPSTNKLGFFLKHCVFLVQFLLIFLFSGNFSNVFNITKLKKKEKDKCFFLVMNFFILDFFFTTMKKHEEN